MAIHGLKVHSEKTGASIAVYLITGSDLYMDTMYIKYSYYVHVYMLYLSYLIYSDYTYVVVLLFWLKKKLFRNIGLK